MEFRRNPARPFVALIAAYAIALQALLAGMVLGTRSGEAAVFAAGSLCLGNSSRSDHAPQDQASCCIGMACCQTGSDPGALPQVATLAPQRIERVAFFAARIGDVDAAAIAGPQQPRAPPA